MINSWALCYAFSFLSLLYINVPCPSQIFIWLKLTWSNYWKYCTLVRLLRSASIDYWSFCFALLIDQQINQLISCLRLRYQLFKVQLLFIKAILRDNNISKYITIIELSDHLADVLAYLFSTASVGIFYVVFLTCVWFGDLIHIHYKLLHDLEPVVHRTEQAKYYVLNWSHHH